MTMNNSLPARGKVRCLLIVLLVAVVLVAIVSITQDHGPTYQGRTAIGWTEPVSEIPADVINAFGPDATPYLILAAYFRKSIPTLRGS
ncbi:MAG: hypothetical protein DME22_19895 [Verrucomicrobia bacterium]|nr:MAG: hypothetical protein DME22_19895 [Verrucomicrobiota bacterium]PYJ98632.1 MAG: hypothetical protein DME23_11560 [Verrucomicrobiota bacterium]